MLKTAFRRRELCVLTAGSVPVQFDQLAQFAEITFVRGFRMCGKQSRYEHIDIIINVNTKAVKRRPGPIPFSGNEGATQISHQAAIILAGKEPFHQRLHSLSS
jgi:hypothetical protein